MALSKIPESRFITRPAFISRGYRLNRQHLGRRDLRVFHATARTWFHKNQLPRKGFHNRLRKGSDLIPRLNLPTNSDQNRLPYPKPTRAGTAAPDLGHHHGAQNTSIAGPLCAKNRPTGYCITSAPRLTSLSSRNFSSPVTCKIKARVLSNRDAVRLILACGAVNGWILVTALSLLRSMAAGKSVAPGNNEAVWPSKPIPNTTASKVGKLLKLLVQSRSLRCGVLCAVI